jgi:hypothetical protein
MALDKDDIKALIAILQKGLVDEDESDNDIEEPVHIKPVKKKTSVPTTKPKKKKAINKFDKMAEFSMCKEDTEIDKKIKKPPPSIRNRPFDFIKVQCRVCGKKEKVAPMLVESTERYKCNKCSTGAG